MSAFQSSPAISSEPLSHSDNQHSEIIQQLLDGNGTWDRRLIEWSNWFNPILVKETRQALKSRQFVWTFGLLVIVVLSWSLLCILGTIPNIYYASDGRVLLSGYLLILVVPAFIIIPQSAFRSMSSELDDGTFETLSLSMLKPRHILFGKLNVASLQLIIYMSVVAPCIALTYLLRGITLELILFDFLVVTLTTLSLSVVAIALASFSRSRVLQVLFSVILIGLQLIVIFPVTSMLIALTFSGLSGSASAGNVIAWTTLAVVGASAILYSWLLFSCAASIIGLSSENKSTPIRIPLLVIGIIIPIVGLLMTGYFRPDNDGRALVESMTIILTFLAAHWAFAGSLMVGERGFISLRAKRTLPTGFVSRLFTTWLIPGPGTGYVFALLSFCGGLVATTAYMVLAQNTSEFLLEFLWYAIAIVAYLALYLGLGRLMSMLFLSKMQTGRIVATFALIIVLNILAVVISCSLSLFMNGYLRMDYDWYCFINPWWTLGEAYPTSYLRGRTTPEIAISVLCLCAIPITLLNVLLSAKDIVIQRMETPSRVLEERAKILGKTSTDSSGEDVVIDPLQ
jgi:hypothetical protein